MKIFATLSAMLALALMATAGPVFAHAVNGPFGVIEDSITAVTTNLLDNTLTLAGDFGNCVFLGGGGPDDPSPEPQPEPQPEPTPPGGDDGTGAGSGGPTNSYCS